jgi:hypothetical protein
LASIQRAGENLERKEANLLDKTVYFRPTPVTYFSGALDIRSMT